VPDVTTTTQPTDPTRNETRSTVRRRGGPVAIGVLCLTLLATAVGCGGDDGESTTTAVPDSEQSLQEQGAPSTIPVETVPDEEFTTVVAGLQTQVDSASDACGLLDFIINAGNLPTPANPAQTEQAATLLAGVLDKLGASPPAGQEAAGATLRNAASALLAEGEASGWDPSTISDSDVIGADVQTALGSIASSCPGLAPAGAPDPSTPG
jgi:hypothetical protein